jgi:hypothetical protein
MLASPVRVVPGGLANQLSLALQGVLGYSLRDPCPSQTHGAAVTFEERAVRMVGPSVHTGSDEGPYRRAACL